MEKESIILKAISEEVATRQSAKQQWRPDVTVAAIIEQDNHFLMVEEFSQGKLVLNQPAGHLEDGETLIQAVEREVNEETAWIFHPEAVVGLYLYPSSTRSTTYLRVCFTGSCSNFDPEQTLDHGIQQALWMSLDEIRTQSERLRSPSIMASFEDYLNGHRFPLEYLKYHTHF